MWWEWCAVWHFLTYYLDCLFEWSQRATLFPLRETCWGRRKEALLHCNKAGNFLSFAIVECCFKKKSSWRYLRYIPKAWLMLMFYNRQVWDKADCDNFRTSEQSQFPPLSFLWWGSRTWYGRRGRARSRPWAQGMTCLEAWDLFPERRPVPSAWLHWRKLLLREKRTKRWEQ